MIYKKVLYVMFCTIWYYLYKRPYIFLRGWNPLFSEGTPRPLSRYPLFLKQIKKVTPLFLIANQIGTCKL